MSLKIGVPRSTASFAQELGRQKRPKEALQALTDLAKDGIQPDAQAATALIDACSKNGKMEMAQQVFDELFGKGDLMQPDEMAFRALVSGYLALNPPAWTTVSALLVAMERRFAIRPSLVSSSSALEHPPFRRAEPARSPTPQPRGTKLKTCSFPADHVQRAAGRLCKDQRPGEGRGDHPEDVGPGSGGKSRDTPAQVPP